MTGQVTRFYRDADGVLVKKSDGAGTVMIVGSHFEHITTTNQSTSYYMFGGQRMAMRVAGVVYWLHGDHLGSASLTTNVSGQKVAELRYLPFGETRWAWGTTPTDRRYTGQRELAGVGLYDYNARMYWPGAGRFVSADTVVPGPDNPQQFNRYTYVLNSPLRHIDPTGHSCRDPGATEDECRTSGGGGAGVGGYGGTGKGSATFIGKALSWVERQLRRVARALGLSADHAADEETPTARPGRLINSAPNRKLAEHERRIVGRLLLEGKTVEIESEEGPGRHNDIKVDGVRTEMKHVSRLNETDPDRMSKGLSGRIQEGAGQAPHIIVDATEQAGMTRDIALRGIRRAWGAMYRRGDTRIQQIRVIGPDFDIVETFDPDLAGR